MSKAVLVTGGAGYVGCHSCKLLKKAGFLPVTYDNLKLGHRYAVKWGPLIQGDINDKNTLKKAFNEYKPIAVMHFAAFSLVGESMNEPKYYYDNNVGGTINLLTAMHEHNVKNIVFSSTCATYGNPTTIPITEDHPQNPINPYGSSKLMIEQILKDFERAYGFNYAALRYFNAAGADVDTEVGENHLNETHLIPLVLRALDSKMSLSVFGDDFETDDGTAIRDYIHVTDLGFAHINALKILLEKKNSLSINLGTGKGFSVLDIIKAVERVCKIKVPYKIAKRREGDPPILIANNTKAKKVLNWELKYSDIDTIIDTAWRWHNHLKSM